MGELTDFSRFLVSGLPRCEGVFQIPQPVAAALDIDDVGGVQQPVEDSGGGGSDVVSFEVDPQAGPQCYGADDISTFQGSFSTTVDCTWHCADYSDREKAWVSIDFARGNEAGATWEKSHEFISSGVC